MQFSLIPQEGDKFSFQVQTDGGDPILDSPFFQNRENCIASIRGFVDQIRDPNAVNIVENQGSFSFNLLDEAGEVWMSSLAMESRDELEAKLQALQEKASGNTSFEVNMRRQRRRKLPSLPKEINFAELYDFSLVARSKKLGFHPVQGKENKKHYFVFNNDTGTPILYSRSFNSPTQRDNRIRSIIKQAKNPKKFEILQGAEGAFIILKGSNGKEIARSRVFANENNAQQALTLMQDKIPTFEKKYPAPPKKPRKIVNVYHLDYPSQSKSVGFDTFSTEEKLHYFHFNDEGGNPILFSEGYSSSRSRNNGLKSVIRNAGLQSRYEKKEKDGKPYFVLLAANRQEIGRSKNFESILEMDSILDWLRVTIPTYAAQYGVQLIEDESFRIEVEREEELDSPVIVPPGGSDIGVLDDTSSDHHTHIPDGDTNVASEASVDTNSEGISWDKIWPWLLVAALILLLIFLARSCDTSNSALTPAELDNKPVMSESSTSEKEEGPTSPGKAELRTEAESSDVAGESADELSPNEGSAGSATETDEDKTETETESTASSPAGSVTSSFGFAPNSMLAKMEAFLTGSTSGKSPIYIMDHARFPFNSPKLNKEAEAELDNLTKLLSAYPNAKLNIFGHLDMNEDDYYSGPFAEEFLTLSDIRARCIYRKLIERGVDEERLSFDGLAKQRLLEKKVDPINRRLELELVK